MGLNVSKGQMYEWVTHTWNTIKGKCPHDCSYCYMKKWGELKPIRFDEGELKTDLGEGNFIFVGSSCDMWAEHIPAEWIIKTLNHCNKFSNTYLFQSKNPRGFISLGAHVPDRAVLCITLETNRVYPQVMRNAPDPIERSILFGQTPLDEKYITVEPIMDFDLNSFVEMIYLCRPIQVNIGADSGGNNLPEPSPQKVADLIEELSVFTTVKQKSNLKRLCS